MVSSFKAKCAFVYAGIGTQWKTMGADLLKDQPVFRDILDHCDSAFAEFSNWSIIKEINRPATTSRIDNLLIAHPCNISIQIGLSALLQEWNIVPDAVVGHSSGEIAAAYMAGILSLKDAMHLTWRHCELMSQIIGKGILVHIGLPVAEVRQILQAESSTSSPIWVSAINSPSATVVTGSADILTPLVRRLEHQKIFCRILRINIPYHSPVVEPFTPDLYNAIRDLKPKPACLPIYSSLRGRLPFIDDFGPEYWPEHISQPVRFSEVITAMLADGYRTFIEISPHGVLGGAIEECAKAFHINSENTIGSDHKLFHVLAVSTLKRFTEARVALTESLALLVNARHLDPESLPSDIKSTVMDKMAFIGQSESTEVMAGDSSDKSIKKLVQNMTPEVAANLIRETVKSATRGMLTPPSDNTMGFLEMGLTSQHAVLMAKYLSSAIGRNLSATMMFDHPNILSLANFLSHECANLEGVNVDFGDTSYQKLIAAPYTKSKNSDIAVIGMACRFPGSANNPDKFHKLLMEGRCAIQPVPSSRWNSAFWFDSDPDMPGKTYCQTGGFLEDSHILDLDAAFFRISPKEALSLDPQQRLLLETVWEAFEDAGITPYSCSEKRVGVYVGLSTMDYMGAHLWSPDPKLIDGYSATGSMYCAAAGRISYLLNLHGPNFAVDTACSSALTAIDCACQALRSGVIDSAIVAGVNVMVNPHLFVYFSKLGALSTSGRCRTFDAEADGYIRGEGAGAILLKPLEQAIADKDRILAVIKGTAVNHDGASSSFTAPNGTAQQKVIRLALENAGVSHLDVDYVEAHGTGTRLGDPVEIQALGAVYGENRPKDHPLWVGSVKSSIGHLEAAAGMASIIKTIMVLNSGIIPPQAGFDTPNPLIPWNELPVRIPTRQTRFGQKNRTRIAGVSGFGFSGTNAHVILAQPTEVLSDKKSIHNTQIVLDTHSIPNNSYQYNLTISAKNQDALTAYCRDYIDFIKQMDDNPECLHKHLTDMCHTAKVGRTTFDYRFSATGIGRDDLVTALEKFVAASNKLTPAEHYTHTPVDLYTVSSDPVTQTGGITPTGKPAGKKIYIPTYPFQRKRFWMNPVATKATTEKLSESAGYLSNFKNMSVFPGQRIFLPPINDMFNNRNSERFSISGKTDNSSVWDQDVVVYNTEFNTESPSFIPEHIIYGEPIVPAAAYLSQLFSYFIAQEFQSSNNGNKAAYVQTRNLIDQNLTGNSLAITRLIGAGVDIRFSTPMVVHELRSVQLICLNSDHQPSKAFKIISRTETEPWITHCEGLLESGEKDKLHESGEKGETDEKREAKINWPNNSDKPFATWIDDFCKNSRQAINGLDFYANFKTLGYDLGAGFCRIERAYCNQRKSAVQAICSLNLSPDSVTQGYDLYPGFIDAMLQSLVFGLPQILETLTNQSKILIPFALDRFEVYEFSGELPFGQSVITLVNTREEADYIQGDIRVFTPDGIPLLSFLGLTVKLTDQTTLLKGLRANQIKDLSQTKNLSKITTEQITKFYTINWEDAEESGVKSLNLDQTLSVQSTIEPTISSSKVLIFADNGGLGNQICKKLEALGVARQIILRENFYQELENLKSYPNKPFRIIYLWACDLIFEDNLTAIELRQQQLDVLSNAMLLINTLAESGRPFKFYGITRGAFSIPLKKSSTEQESFISEKASNAIQQTLWGLGKTVALEYPEYFGGLIDFDLETDSNTDKSQIDHFISDFLTQESLDQRAYRISTPTDSVKKRDSKLFYPRIKIVDLPRPAANLSNLQKSSSQSLDPNAAYLITGASGGLGLPIARKLVELGAKQLWLLVRRQPQPQFLEAVRELETKEIEIKILQVDLCDIEKLNCELERLSCNLPTIKGVIHLAGIRQDALLPLQTPESLAAVIDPKAVGAWNLHNLVKNLKLDFFILFSSAASLLGSQGQANYAAANAFLDGLADYRHSLGLPAMSIHWGPWAESGMAAWETVVHKNLTSLGFDYLSPEQGLTALESLLNVHTSPVAVFECDWSVYMNRTGQHQSALFKDMISGLTVDTQPCPTVALLWQELEELIPEQRSKKLLSQLTILAREVSGSDTPVAPDRPLMEQGFDSLMAVEFRNQLQKICGFSLPVTLLFTYPGLVEISEFLQKRHYNIQKKSDSDKNYQSADIEQKYEDNKNADNDKMGQSTEAVTETDFAYLDQLTPEELNELIAKDLDI